MWPNISHNHYKNKDTYSPQHQMGQQKRPIGASKREWTSFWWRSNKFSLVFIENAIENSRMSVNQHIIIQWISKNREEIEKVGGWNLKNSEKKNDLSSGTIWIFACVSKIRWSVDGHICLFYQSHVSRKWEIFENIFKSGSVSLSKLKSLILEAKRSSLSYNGHTTLRIQPVIVMIYLV